MTTKRILEGVQRIATDEWRWGCWRINRRVTPPTFASTGAPWVWPWVWWIATDDASDLNDVQHMERVVVSLFPREFMQTLSDRGPDVLNAEGIAELDRQIAVREQGMAS